MHARRRFTTDESGATAIEYALIATLIAVAAIAGFAAMGDSLAALFDGNGGAAGRAIEGALDSAG